MQVDEALPAWRREFIATIALAPDTYLDQLETHTSRDLAWWRSCVGTLPDDEWPTAVRRMIRANEDRLADILLARANRTRPDQ